MRSDEAKIADAVAALRARLDGWGVEDPDEKAAAYVNDMLRNGWRPRALPTAAPEPRPRGPRPDPTEHVKQCRAELARAKRTEPKGEA